ncbi:MAG TPA: hypothetical protein PLP27_12995 [Crocinitomicaceae bacterium]|nr:hypothetical protein [Crocinitomicaceae bacterium]
MVLNEGLFQLNNASMSWVDLESGTVNNQIFEERTGRKIGDTGNDMLVYGSKLYLVTSVSSTLEILNANDLTSLKQLSIVENGTAQQPQNLTAINGEVYISTFGGKVWVIDTTTLDVKTKIQVGLNPDKIANDGTYIYVSNSGGLNNPIYDSTVSVINPITKQELKRIVLDINPSEILVGSDNSLYVITRGNYTSVPAKLHRINRQTLERDTTFAIEAIYLESFSNTHFLVAYTNSVGKLELAKFNMQTQQIEAKNFIDISQYTTFYGIHYESSTQQFILNDAHSYTTSGEIKIYNQSGQFLKSYLVGLNPGKILVKP